MYFILFTKFIYYSEKKTFVSLNEHTGIKASVSVRKIGQALKKKLDNTTMTPTQK